jgi:hypothetical protein
MSIASSSEEVDIFAVKRLLSHSKLATTERCLHLVDDDPAAAVDRVFPEVSG